MNQNILKTYIFHFLGALFSLILFLLGVSFYLNRLTKHGEYINTPKLTNIPIQDAIKIIRDHKLRYSITDSIYIPNTKSGIVISQNPEADTKVKENRIIYLSITRFQPPGIEMPKLVDLSERQAIMVLKSYDLKIGKITYEPSYCNGCVVKQLYNHTEIKPGTQIKKGSIIDLVIGQKKSSISPSLSDTINTEETSLELD